MARWTWRCRCQKRWRRWSQRFVRRRITSGQGEWGSIPWRHNIPLSALGILFSYSNYILELLDLALSFLQTALSLITMTFYDLSLSSSSSAASLNLFFNVLLRECWQLIFLFTVTRLIPTTVINSQSKFSHTVDCYINIDYVVLKCVQIWSTNDRFLI